ncbi:shikimate kinase [Caldimonas thermodepolymerans]|uniref:shikimate kinase n=1 Tax=Caldimonas thermodepolymerans TaxID=215580 RepID=UPI001E654331|nr:shikimate kinase [Caldimonas thermodepolymerans]UZG48802.1 shikimate kinase [Caldimonas thermodepolymerans]
MSRDVKLALVGLPGSGKSTIGRQLAQRLGVPFLDSDAEIEARLGTSIRAYFEQHGEAAFRDIEAQVLQELCERDAFVLATGGGAVLREANRRTLKQACTVVYLRASVDDLWRRLRHDTKRPLLQVPDAQARLRQLHAERAPLYEEIADIAVDTGRPSARAVTRIIAMQVELADQGTDAAPPTDS